MIRRIQIILASTLCAGAFACGRQQQSSAVPVNTSICFLRHNGELFVQRQFLTSAHIMLDVHGEILQDPLCPDVVLSFTSSPDIGDRQHELDAELTAQLANRGYADVPITFVGTLNVPSRMENASVWLKRQFGIQVKRRAEIAIDRIISVGKAAN